MPHHTTSRDPGEEDDEAARTAAAVLIQRLWRKKNHSTLDEYPLLDANARWEDAAIHAQFAVRYIDRAL